MISCNTQSLKSKNKIYKILNLNNIITKYIALPFPEYQEYMEEKWFMEESYYDCDRDVYLIPIDRVHITSIDYKYTRI